MYRNLGLGLIIVLVITMALAGCGGVSNSVSPSVSPSLSPSPSPTSTPQVEAGITISGSGTYQISVAGLSWVKVDATIASHMSTLTPYDSYENNPYTMNTDSASNNPNLSSISGGGFYIESTSDSTNELMLQQIKWVSGGSSVDESFGAANWQAIVQNKGHEVLATSAHTGFKWGGFANNQLVDNNPIIMDEYYDGRIQFTGAVAGPGNAAGNYVYTIFDNTGDKNPDQTVSNLASGSITVAVNATADAVYPQKIRLLIRDASGDWYLSVGGTAVIQ